jgi:iron complex outermembrane recepter protein
MQKSFPLILCLFFSLSLHARELEVLTVTARKIEESAQSVPMSLSVYTEDEMKQLSKDRLRELIEHAPNVQMVGPVSSRYLTPYIRGIGNLDLNLPDDIAVNFYLDEVPLPRYAFDLSVFDLERVEVLRGPQGTLFGKNTQAGAVALSSRRPPPGQSRHTLVGAVGNLSSFQVGGSSENSFGSGDVGHRISLNYRERGGYIPDTVLARDLGDTKRFTVSESLFYDPTERFSLLTRVAFQRETGNDPNIIARGTSNYPVSGNDILPGYKNNLITTSVRWDFRFNSTTLTGIHGFNYYDFSLKYDELDFYAGAPYLGRFLSGPALTNVLNDPNSFYRDLKEYDRSLFNELRLASDQSKRWRWTLGVNANQTNYRLGNFVNTIRFGFIPPSTLTQSELLITQNVGLKGNHLASFGETSLNITDSTTLTLGARYNYDEKKYRSSHSSTQLAFYEQDTSKSFHGFTGRFIVAQKLLDATQTYLSLARGYRPGGYPAFQFNNYSGDAIDQLPYAKSQSTTYEWGVKSDINRRARINTSVFLTELEGNQVRIRDADTRLNRYENIDTQIYGGELESIYLLTQDFSFQLNLGVSKTRFKERKQVSTTQTLALNGQTANVPTVNAASYLHYAPYLHSLGGALHVKIGYRYVGGRYGENTNLTRLPSYGLWDSLVAFETDRWSLGLRAQNLFDKVYETQGFLFESIRSQVSSPGLPRLVMLEGSFVF